MADPTIRGKLEPEILRQMVADGRIHTVLTVFPDMYGRLVGKRITGNYFVEEVLNKAIHACDYLLASDMEMEPIPGYEYSNWERGYGDFRLIPDLQTLRIADWLEGNAIVMCDVFEEDNDALVSVAPRTILQRQLSRAADQNIIALGGSELEFYIFKDTYGEAADKNYNQLEPVSNYIEDYHILQGTKEEFIVGAIRKHIDNSGIPVEFSKGEWGPGQQEINLRYAQVLEMSDRHCIYKHAVKEIAWQKDCAITFMSKWDERYAGSSFHLHLSLWDRTTGEALFPGDEKIGSLETSALFHWFLGGWMAHLREIFAFYAPYPTSYKRYASGSFAPTAIGWSVDNRTAGFRVIGHGNSLRIECRVPGADANPYLAYAASIAAGLDGIENQIEPPPMFEGDAYASRSLERVPLTLNDAILELEASTWARKTFGKQVVDHYLHFFRTEQEAFDRVVTDWERKRYFERG